MENQIDNEEGFGQTSIDDTFEGWRIIKLKTPKPGEAPTELVFRLLPAMKSYRNSGKWTFFYGQHFGHAGVGKSPEKPRVRPFGCIQVKNFKTKQIEVECPKCVEMEKVKLKEKNLMAKVQQANPNVSSEKELEALYKNTPALMTVRDWLKKNNKDSKFWMNVMTEKGEFGPLTLSYTTTEKLRTKLREWADKKKIDAFSLEKGVWIRIVRTGSNGLNDEVQLVTESFSGPDGQEYERTKFAPMSKDQQERALKACPDLQKDVVKFLSAEKIQKLIDCSNNPAEVDEIWDGPKAQTKGGSSSSANLENDESDLGNVPDDELPAWAGGNAPEPVKQSATPTPEPQVSEEDAQMAALQAQMAALAAKKAAKPAQAPVPAAAGIESAADFLSQFQPKP